MELPLVGWQVVGLAGIVVLYLSLPASLRRVAIVKSLVFNVAFALACLAGALTMVMKINGCGLTRIGVGTGHLGPASIAAAAVTVAGIVVLAGMCRLAGRGPVLTINMVKLAAVYPPWAYVQQLLLMGVLLNLLADWLGSGAATIIGGLCFGLIHWGSRVFFLSTVAIGLVYAWSFLDHPNLLPLAISHSVLGPRSPSAGPWPSTPRAAARPSSSGSLRFRATPPAAEPDPDPDIPANAQSRPRADRRGAPACPGRTWRRTGLPAASATRSRRSLPDVPPGSRVCGRTDHPTRVSGATS